MTVVIRIEDGDRIRRITFDRPDALNAFNEALYDATTEALIEAATAPAIAVVVLTGNGRAFSAGTDVVEMAALTTGEFVAGTHGFPGMVDQLASFPKPLISAVNGMALGIGATMLGLADLVFMSTEARIRCPFTALARGARSREQLHLPVVDGPSAGSWALLSSEWLSAEDCVRDGLAWRVCAPEELLDEAMAHARCSRPSRSRRSSRPSGPSSPRSAEPIAFARERENQAYRRLFGAPANLEASPALARTPPSRLRLDRRAVPHGSRR